MPTPNPKPQTPLKRTLYTGTFISTPSPSPSPSPSSSFPSTSSSYPSSSSSSSPIEFQILENYAIAVDERGVIVRRSALVDEDAEGWAERVWGAGDWKGEGEGEEGDKGNRGEGEGKAGGDGREGNKGEGWEVVRGGGGKGRVGEGEGEGKGKGKGEGWWFPGFVDTHIHASQYPNVGIFGKSTLLDWLNTYTFPLESSLSSLTKACRVYSACVSRTLSHGTTTAAYYPTIHVAPTNLLADICLEKGQRAFIGRVCMDTDLNPEYLRDESPEQAMEDTKATIAHIDSVDPNHALITPIITPRFALSCSSPLLSDLGAIAKETDLPIQTHLSENTSEIELVHKRFPNHESYSHVYDSFGLLTPKTVLAHCVHLAPIERKLLKERGSKVSHCPVSNTSLSSGLCPVRELLDDGIEVGLGTDVSGGYSASILVAAREAAMVSRTLAAITAEEPEPEKKNEPSSEEKSVHETKPKHSTSAKDRKKLSVEECLYLATTGGARCLGLEKTVGAFEVGMHFDAQFVQLDDAHDDEGGEGEGEGEGEGGAKAEADDKGKVEEGGCSTSKDQGPVELWGKETWGEKVAKWLFCGDDRNTKMVFVGGRLVHERL